MEEASLMERYGQAWSSYKAKVKRFLPYVY
jgi:protein-S-isoprenylcysteine O-methyltransferase Ste14